MVKGISKQVIVVRPPDPKLFEQAIFILTENGMKKDGITDQELLKEADFILHKGKNKGILWMYGLFWACIGAAACGTILGIAFFI